MDEKRNVLYYLDNQQFYNSRKATNNKRFYYLFEVGMIFFTCMTTLLLTFENIPCYLPTISSILAILLKSISVLFSFHKEWLSCRALSEKIKSEKRKYIFSIGDYDLIDQDSKDKKLAENLEIIINHGNTEWYEEHKVKEQTK
ncbi:MAG: DUF4231 domain-containing protein [Treponema sp.]